MLQKIVNAICNFELEIYILMLCAVASICLVIRCIVDKEPLIYLIFGIACGIFSSYAVICDIIDSIKSQQKEEDK